MDRLGSLAVERGDQPTGVRRASRFVLAATGWALAACALSMHVAVARAEQAPRAVTAQSAVGCCVCRAAVQQQYQIKSCADGYSIDACAIKCRAEGAASLAYGYQQTCQQGCAGFPTAGR